ncbi:hypothetical protein Vadar_020876 [Vaccinium darrowii]|uniref:Uncharacterized protein n=1 Tax=Vaccinium darrowii TaxID=229202 RepID=A0ACB7ZLU0_9ERIC|nr:hypothetical protein Vadar_020876 [Vaccinium darrowii]
MHNLDWISASNGFEPIEAIAELGDVMEEVVLGSQNERGDWEFCLNSSGRGGSGGGRRSVMGVGLCGG